MKAFLENLCRLMLTAYLGLALRLLALVPLYFVYTEQTLKFPEWVLILFSLVLWVFAVLPWRVHGRYALRICWNMPYTHADYVCLLKAGLKRVLLGMVYGIPFIASAVLWHYGYHVINFKLFYNFLKDVGAFFGGRTDTGLIAVGVVMVVTALVYALGWWLYTPADTLGPKVPLRCGKKLLIRHVSAYIKVLLVNICLLLPSIALWFAALFLHYQSRIEWSGSMLSLLQNVSEALKTPLPGTLILRLAFVLIVVHVPLCLVRKYRYAALTCALERDDQTAIG